MNGTGLTPDAVEKLRQPFPIEAHELRDGGRDGKLVYLTEEPLADRLTEVDPNWQFRIIEVVQTDYRGEKADSVTVHAELTVCGITRANLGVAFANMKTREWDNGKKQYVNIDPPIVYPLSETEVKGAATDALKRCARLFGCGVYLLRTKGEKFQNERDFANWYNREFGKRTPPPADDRRLVKPEPAQMPDNGAGKDESHWTHDMARLRKFLAWAEDFWKPIERPHAVNRLAKALGINGTPNGSQDLLFEMILAQYDGSDTDAAKAVQLYEPAAPPADARLMPDTAMPLDGACDVCGETTINTVVGGAFRCTACAEQAANEAAAALAKKRGKKELQPTGTEG